MKKYGFVLMVILSLLLFSIASAQTGIPGSGWWSGQQVQNVGAADATIMITAYGQAAGEFSETKTVGPGEAYTFTPINEFPGMPAGFQGSAVVSSNQPIKAIVNVTNQPAANMGVPGGKAAAQYQGTDGSAVATTLYFPLAKGAHFGKTTSFYIQNAGAAAATGVVATFTMRNGDTHMVNLPTIQPNRMVVFSVHDAATYSPTENNGRVGGLVVTGPQLMAGTVMEHDTVANPAVVLNSTRGFTLADFDTKAYAPVVKHDRFGRFTGIQVQNTSASPIDVTVSYRGTGGPCAGSTFQDTATGVPAGESKTFVHLGAANTNVPANCTASATITATGTFVALTNEQEVAGAPKAGITYSAMNDGSATNRISVPLFKDDRFGARTGLQIQNVGASPAVNWTATFSCRGAAIFTAVSDPAKTGPIQPGGAFLFYRPSTANLFTNANPFASSNVNCAVIVQSDQPVVAIANETSVVSGELDDNNYEGFNLAP
jgi:hypothetical protein